MTSILGKLKPINDDNSIKEATITLFLDNRILNTQKFEVLLTKHLKDNFNKFENVNKVAFHFKGNAQSGIESSGPQLEENIGFRFQFFSNGKLTKAFQGVNEEIRNYFSFHSLDYKDWDVFFPEFKVIIKNIAEFQSELNVIAFSLHYIDAFVWEGVEEIDMNAIFNENSSLLPSGFFKDNIQHYNLTTIKNNKYKYYDRLEISTEQTPRKLLSISHSVIHNLVERESISNFIAKDIFENGMNDAHEHNKAVLFNILNPEVCNLIGLKQ